MNDTIAKPSRIPLPPLIYVCAIALSVILHYIYPLPWFSGPFAAILFAAGGLAVLGAAALFYTAVTAMARAKTTINPNGVPDHLVTSGPFSFSRNPIYLADTLLMIGVGLVSAIAWFPVLAVIAAFITRKAAIEREEKVLKEKFGKRYLDYAKRIRRWI